MTQTGSMPSPSAPAGSWETCDHCQAPLDERQRYCVACGARRANVPDPAARYLANASRRSRSAAAPANVPPPARSSRSTLTTAAVLALLPLVAGIGVLVGRSAQSDDELLLEVLKAQKAPVVNVGAGAAARDGASAGGPKKKADDAGRVKDDNPNDADGKVIAKTQYGTARQLTGSKPTPAQLEESKKALDRIVNSQGKEYVEQQRGLPDQIIIP